MSSSIVEKERKFDQHVKLLREAKDLSVLTLLLDIGKKHAGSNTEKLRAEACDKFKINSNTDYNFGITGQSGVGKSTLINAICGYDDNDPRAAKVDIVECTETVGRYPHPMLKHLILYDLPGAGTIEHPSHTYFCDKRLYVFDCLLLVMSERIRETDLAIARLAQEMGTPVVFVRNKALNDLNTMRQKTEFKNLEEKKLIELTMAKIKKNIYEELKVAKINDPQVFIIEAHSLRKFNNLSAENLLQLEKILLFEELELYKYMTKLASSRSRISLPGLLMDKSKTEIPDNRSSYGNQEQNDFEALATSFKHLQTSTSKPEDSQSSSSKSSTSKTPVSFPDNRNLDPKKVEEPEIKK
uniref:IRG-type G domain-containing protein n=1 Tax=Panagrolaimus sp. JU765 TaxID=591449 RepID=A0AC34RN46_9BILA